MKKGVLEATKNQKISEKIENNQKIIKKVSEVIEMMKKWCKNDEKMMIFGIIFDAETIKKGHSPKMQNPRILQGKPVVFAWQKLHFGITF